MRPLVVVGAGGFGRETLDVVDALNALTPAFEVVGVADDGPSPANLERLAGRGVRHIGGVDDIPGGTNVAVAVGSPGARRRIVERLGSDKYHYPSLVHPTAVIGSLFRHRDGLIVLGGVSIGTNVSLGQHVHLSAHAVLGHDAILGDFVSVNPNATVSGAVRLGAGTLVGAGSVILQGLSVGQRAVVGGAACVVKDVKEDTVVVGVPARCRAKAAP